MASGRGHPVRAVLTTSAFHPPVSLPVLYRRPIQFGDVITSIYVCVSSHLAVSGESGLE